MPQDSIYRIEKCSRMQRKRNKGNKNISAKTIKRKLKTRERNDKKTNKHKKPD